MKKLLFVLISFSTVLPAEKKLVHEVTDAMVAKQVSGYHGMAKKDQDKVKLDYAKKMRRGMHVKHLLDIDDLFNAGGVIGSQMKKIDKEFCSAIRSLDKQISHLEKHIRENGGDGSSGLGKVGYKIKNGCKKAWCKVKSGCVALKNKISGNSKKHSVESSELEKQQKSKKSK